MSVAQQVVLGYFRAKLNLLSVLSKRKAAEQAFRLFCTPLRKKREIPAIFTKAERLWFDFERYKISGYRWNHPADQKLLIVHGFESSPYNFDRYVIPLTKKGYEVLAFEAPAHGNSSGKQITVPLYVEMLRKADELYGPFTGFIAHSLGGLALSMFLESIGTRKGLKAVFVAPATESTTAIRSFFRVMQLGDAVRDEFERIIVEKGGYPSTHYSVRRALNTVDAQVLWFHDEQDPLTPIEDALPVREDNHPNVQFVITSGLGHSRIYKENKVVRQILEFL